MPAEPENILVIHFGQLGDVIVGLPAIDAIRGRYPGAHITTLSGTPADQMLRLSRLADECIAVDRWGLKLGPKHRAVGSMIGLARDLRRRRFDTIVDLHTYYETGLLAWLSGAGRRVGGLRDRRTLKAAYTALAPLAEPSEHFVERYLSVAKMLGAEARTTEPRLYPDEGAAQFAEMFVDKIPGEGPLIGFNPGAGWEIRRWPSDSFAETGRRLVAQGARVCVFAGPEEKGLGASIASSIGSGAVSGEGLTLGQLAAVMARSALVVSNDTGPAHIAAAVGAPVLVLMPGDTFRSPLEVRSSKSRQIAAATVHDISIDEVASVAAAMLLGPLQS